MYTVCVDITKQTQYQKENDLLLKVSIKVILVNKNIIATKLQITTNFNIVQTCFYSLQFTSAENQYLFNLDLHISEKEMSIAHNKGTHILESVT